MSTFEFKWHIDRLLEWCMYLNIAYSLSRNEYIILQKNWIRPDLNVAMRRHNNSCQTKVVWREYAKNTQGCAKQDEKNQKSTLSTVTPKQKINIQTQTNKYRASFLHILVVSYWTHSNDIREFGNWIQVQENICLGNLRFRRIFPNWSIGPTHS